MSPFSESAGVHPTSSTRQFPSLCLLATKVYVTPLIVVLRRTMLELELVNRNRPVPSASTENSVDVPGYAQRSPGSTIKSTVQVPSETGARLVVAESVFDAEPVPAELMAETL